MGKRDPVLCGVLCIKTGKIRLGKFPHLKPVDTTKRANESHRLDSGDEKQEEKERKRCSDPVSNAIPSNLLLMLDSRPVESSDTDPIISTSLSLSSHHPGLLGIRRMRDPSRRRPRRRLLHHPIYLLQAQPLGLGDAKVGEQQTQTTRAAPDEEDLRLQIALILVHHVGSNDTDNAVPEPITRRRERHALGADWQGEQLADDDPCGRAPGRGERENVDADEGDEDFACRARAGGGGADYADDEFADEHQQCAVDEKGAAAEALDGVKGEGRGADIDDIGYDGD